VSTYRYRGYTIKGSRGFWQINSPSGENVTYKLRRYACPDIDTARYTIDRQSDAGPMPVKRTRTVVRVKTPRVVTDSGRRAAGFSHETNDCTVRAISNARCIPYADAHTFVATLFNRKDGGRTGGWETGLQAQSWCKLVTLPPGPVGSRHKMTLDRFVTTHPRGHYIVTIRGHTLAVCDGVAYDAGRLSGLVRVLSVFEVTG
jgi:hypothetical protein